MKKLCTSILLLLFVMGCDNSSEQTSINIKKDGSLENVKQSGVLRWGADVIGGIPYVYEDPDKPGDYIGFEMDIAKGIARHLGVKLKLVIKAWDTLIPELQKNSFDIAMNGIEDTEERNNIVQLSNPYYLYTQQITVRKDTDDVYELNDLKNKIVGTLSGTAAEDILRNVEKIKVSINPEIIYSYDDLVKGKIDAVLLDTPIAAAYGATNPKLKNVGKPFGNGYYVIAIKSNDTELLKAINTALDYLKNSGELSKIYKKWGIMNTYQQKLGIQ